MLSNYDNDDRATEDRVHLLSNYPSRESNEIPNSPRRTRSNNTLRYYLTSTRLMKFLGNVLAISTTILILVGVPTIAIYAMVNWKTRADFAALSSAGAFVVITIVISTKLIYNHLNNWYMPDVQKYVVRILWMVPLYAVQSWLSMCFDDARIYIDTLRDLYEAYVIQSFLYYLVELLGGDEAIVAALQEKEEFYGHHHPEILNRFLPKWEMGVDFMLQCKYGVLQYVVAKALASIATACLEPFGFFNAGVFSFTNAYVYIAFVINMSQMWALYCLVRFYHALHTNLREPVNWRPLGKFLCIKLVVFFTWWQGVALAVLKQQGIIADIGQWDADDVANALQDYLVCVEMFCFAIAHSFTFTHLEYMPSNAGQMNERDGTCLLNGTDSERMGLGNGGDDDDYKPPTIRTLHAPMGFKNAFWSSTVPNETLNDIKKFSTGFSDHASEFGMNTLPNVSMQHAESV